MNVSQNICPVCRTANEIESAFCTHCGARLEEPLIDSVRKIKTTDLQAVTPEMIREWSSTDAEDVAVPDNGIAFYINGHSRPASVDLKGEFVLGRKVGATSERLLDLAPFGGYSLGVSRRHVIIRLTGDGYELLDMGSVNGSWLNEERLVPHKSYPLPSGSHLRLGRMQLLVLYRPSAGTQ